MTRYKCPDLKDDTVRKCATCTTVSGDCNSGVVAFRYLLLPFILRAGKLLAQCAFIYTRKARIPVIRGLCSDAYKNVKNIAMYTLQFDCVFLFVVHILFLLLCEMFVM